MPSGKGPLRVAFEDFLKTYKLPKEQQTAFLKYLDGIETSMLGFMGRQIPRYGVDARLAAELNRLLGTRQPGENPAILIALVFVFIGFLTTGANQLLAPGYRALAYAGNEILPNQSPSEREVTAMMWRFGLQQSEWEKTMRRLGHDSDQMARLEQIMRPRLTENETMAALWRGKFNMATFRDYLSKKGWSPDEINVWEELSESLPGIQDTIRFLVRDVTQQGVVDRYGYDEMWPNQTIIELGKKLGYPEQIIQYYWRAHWQLPSPTQVFEMLHRGLLGENGIGVVDEFLRINDYPQFWREKLIGISYTPLRLVDTRNAFKLGVITYDTMRRKFKDRGLNDEDATIAANLVVEQQKEKDRDLSLAQIREVYEIGAMTASDAINDIMAMGYDQAEAQKLLAPATFRIMRRQIEDEIELVHQQFLDGRILSNDARARLTNLDLSGTRIETLIIRWERELKPRGKLPTQPDLEKWAKAQYITTEVYREMLYEIGHREPFVSLYVREVQDALRK